MKHKPYNKRMQTDQPTRYAPGLAADAERQKHIFKRSNMYKLFSLLISVLFISACASGPSQLEIEIEQGAKPRVSVIIAVPNQISTVYIGTTIFENGGKSYPSTVDLSGFIDSDVRTRIQRSDFVTLVPLSRSEYEALDDSIPSPMDRASLRGSEATINSIKNWPHTSKTDYLIFVQPSHSGSPIYNRAGSLLGSGLFVDSVHSATFIVGAYKATVIDSKTMSIVDVLERRKFNKVKNYKKDKLDPDELKAITDKYERESEVYNDRGTGVEPRPLEYQIKNALRYDADEFEALDPDVLSEIEVKAQKVAQIVVENLLRKAGIIY